MNRSPPPYRGQTSIERIVDYLADIFLAVKGIAQELETWNARPVRGRIFFNGVESMTTPTATDIPDNDVPAVIQWEDRFGDINQAVATTWSTQDPNGGDGSAMVTAEPDPADPQRATVTFHAGSGVFQVVATAQGANGPVTAESGLYNIVPGAPAVGQITLNPTPTPTPTPTPPAP